MKICPQCHQEKLDQVTECQCGYRFSNLPPELAVSTFCVKCMKHVFPYDVSCCSKVGCPLKDRSGCEPLQEYVATLNTPKKLDHRKGKISPKEPNPLFSKSIRYLAICAILLYCLFEPKTTSGKFWFIAIALAVLYFHYQTLKPPTPEQVEKERFERERLKKQADETFAQSIAQQEAKHAEWTAKHKEYLRSKRWKNMRERVLSEADYTCEDCGAKATQVHHVKYTRNQSAGEFKGERRKHLAALCAKCHMERHGR